ncbi:5-(carboxyamino)imidazole ribonucleotide mutase [Desulfosporosinus sp. I2]|uniref:5-(carboxyamino)imidazole ribonucleotide mutase n=1 Tax=Desulfosporosinus sp. I2 TaxID=1617025 RepID=UPI00249EA3BC|nr:5-(carboxyamino)imidazole ribonucleotide mutase [Desulfosporosinus sp. I2]
MNRNKEPKVAVIMGSDSDFPVLKGCVKLLGEFGIKTEVSVISAHRTPESASEFAKAAEKNGFSVIIAAAGKAAHLAGVIAAYSTLPVIGIPIKSSTLDGLDSLLSIVQMPTGIPVATVAIDGAENAAILAAQIIALWHDEIRDKIKDYKSQLAIKVEEKDRALKEKIAKEVLRNDE